MYAYTYIVYMTLEEPKSEVLRIAFAESISYMRRAYTVRTYVSAYDVHLHFSRIVTIYVLLKLATTAVTPVS